jgi:hypothetical protein
MKISFFDNHSRFLLSHIPYQWFNLAVGAQSCGIIPVLITQTDRFLGPSTLSLLLTVQATSHSICTIRGWEPDRVDPSIRQPYDASIATVVKVTDLQLNHSDRHNFSSSFPPPGH